MKNTEIDKQIRILIAESLNTLETLINLNMSNTSNLFLKDGTLFSTRWNGIYTIIVQMKYNGKWISLVRADRYSLFNSNLIAEIREFLRTEKFQWENLYPLSTKL